MAKKLNKQSLLEVLKSKAFHLNNEIISASEDLVDGSIKTGEQWQGILGKTLKKGAALLGKQQDITIDTIEAIIKQYKAGDVRFRKLFELENFTFAGLMEDVMEEVEEPMAAISNTVKMAKTTSVKLAKKAVATVQETVAPMVDAVVPAKTKKTTPTAKKVAPTKAVKTTPKKDVVKTTVAKATKTVTKAATTTKKKVAKATPTATKVTAAKPVAKTETKKETVKKEAVATKNDFKKIEGIGPKIEELLNNAGIMTYDQLATTKPAAVKEILLAAGSRYKMHDPTTWAMQAKLASSADWDGLKAFIAELKGGKNTKKIKPR